MGCCCSCCCRDRSGVETETCGTVCWPNENPFQGDQAIRTNHGEPVCKQQASYYTVPLCADHREALKTLIFQDDDNLNSSLIPAPTSQSCLPADCCKVPKCNNAFHCRANICADHFLELATAAFTQKKDFYAMPFERQVSPAQDDGVENRNGNENASQRQGSATEIPESHENVPRTSSDHGIELETVPFRRHQILDAAQDEELMSAPPPYEEQRPADPMAHLQRRVKRPPGE